MLLANEVTYEQLTTFESIVELNEAVRSHKNDADLSPTELAVLDLLAQYSCKYLGVSFLTKTNIGKAVGKSRRTVIRACNRLEELGIIRQYELKRDGGDRRQTSNAIVIQPYQPQYDTPTAAHHKTRQPLKQNNTNIDTGASQTKQANLPNQSLKRSVPEALYNAFSPFFNDDELYEVVGVLFRAKAKINRYIIAEEHTEYIDAFYTAIRLYKRGKVRNLMNYLYRTWESVTSEVCRKLAVYNGGTRLFYDWLNA